MTAGLKLDGSWVLLQMKFYRNKQFKTYNNSCRRSRNRKPNQPHSNQSLRWKPEGWLQGSTPYAQSREEGLVQAWSMCPRKHLPFARQATGGAFQRRSCRRSCFKDVSFITPIATRKRIHVELENASWIMEKEDAMRSHWQHVAKECYNIIIWCFYVHGLLISYHVFHFCCIQFW